MYLLFYNGFVNFLKHKNSYRLNIVAFKKNVNDLINSINCIKEY